MAVEIDISEALARIGADKPGNFKIYAENSRIKLFVKAEKLPTAPTLEITSDLPGDYEPLLAQGANFLLKRGGNATPQPA